MTRKLLRHLKSELASIKEAKKQVNDDKKYQLIELQNSIYETIDFLQKFLDNEK